jgi:hypothetical protein
MLTLRASKLASKLGILIIKSATQLDTILPLKSKRLAEESFLIPLKERD